MTILAVETATPVCSVALWHQETITFLEDLTPHSHTKKILPMVDQLLTKQNLKISDLDAIAFDEGPGSFTGLRIGAGVAQGLALAHNTPVVAIGSLQAVAQQSQAPTMAVALDARMEEVYFACFSFQNEQCVQTTETQVLPIDKITLDPNQNWTLLGNGWQEYGVPEAFSHYPQDFTAMPHAREIAQLATMHKAHTKHHSQALPVYIRTV